MTDPFFVSRGSVFDHQSSKTLKEWTTGQSAAARERGAKYGRVSTHPQTGEVVYEAWTEENPETGEPRWTEKLDAE